ncbi:hypothetical protein [Mangrovimonas sp. YM274]|uniref:hypothetical protein n=1 Tax=Mangrovimonas sp. YM274 TaxID=3070660 RepID=UPI0027DB53AF|nr:hypothetical protein [Mangrovimonas sp. YM274]WMI67574.1 hypothetical protein RBH95_10505 [Mangrovimonas sp. YM274]
MTYFIFEIACICAGLMLAVTTLDRLDGKSNFFVNIAAKLQPLSPIIGILTLAIGIIFIIKFNCIIFALVGIACGILLLPQQLSKVPGIGDSLFKLSQKINPYKVLIGDVALILGVLSLFNMNPFC